MCGRWCLLAVILIASDFQVSGEELRQGSPPATVAEAVSFPLAVSKDRRYLVDGKDRPFLVVGDSAWSLIAEPSEDEIKHYLDGRQKRGFNSIIVSLIEHKFATKAPNTRAGLDPFLKPGDFSTPNPKYFDFAHQVVGWANERGIAVWLCPAYLGWGGGDEGWFQKINAGGKDKLKIYGTFVGERFQDLPNIVWIVGGDYAAPKEHAWTITELADAIRAGGAKQLMTVHGGQQSAVDVVGPQKWIDINNTYSYEGDIHRIYRANYERKEVRPFVLIESAYEGEHQASPARIRRQAYWAMTCGACGQFFGNNPLWYFDGPGFTHWRAYKTWKEALDGRGSRDMAHLRSAFIHRDWHKLTPDFKNALVIKGAGKKEASITAAKTPDGRLAMIYIPSTGVDPREFTVDLRRLSGPVAAFWFNPTTGKNTSVQDQPLPNTEPQVFRTFGDNGTKANDWLLILESRAK